jgi:putative transcriptional regulator
MAISYIRLWKLLLDRRLKRVDLKRLSGISSSTLAKLGKDEYVSMESMDRICKALDAEIGDVMEFVPDSKPAE